MFRRLWPALVATLLLRLSIAQQPMPVRIPPATSQQPALPPAPPQPPPQPVSSAPSQLAHLSASTAPPQPAPLPAQPAGPPASTPKQALDLLNNTPVPDSVAWWPNIKGPLFAANLKANILQPLKIYQGSNTNFCGYAALSYLPLNHDPLSYTRFMLTLYIKGTADWNGNHFEPSPEIHIAAGTLRFKGILDIRPADQLWFLTLADHFKSYLNFLHRRFHPGAEDTFWAAVSYGKFNRMIRQLFHYRVEAKGSDLLRPHFDNLFDDLAKTVQTPGTTYLYVNNTYLHKKNHNKFKGSFPTHFIVLTDIHRIPGETDLVDIIYWDYGGRTLRQVSLRFLKKITFGVTHCTPPPS